MWPNLLHELKRQGAATVMVNGRISEKNFRAGPKRYGARTVSLDAGEYGSTADAVGSGRANGSASWETGH